MAILFGRFRTEIAGTHEQLPEFFLDGHPREKIRNAPAYRDVRTFVQWEIGLACTTGQGERKETCEQKGNTP